MKISKIFMRIIPIISLLILFIFLGFYYFKMYQEPMTNMEAASILPVLYDSSLTNKTKITDLLGITVNDESYNKILNTQNKDADAIISSIKQYIGSSVTFNTPSSEKTILAEKMASTPLAISVTNSSSAPTDATTTKPTTLSITQTPFKERIKENVSGTTK